MLRPSLGQLLFVLQVGGGDAVLIAQPLDDRNGEGFSLGAEQALLIQLRGDFRIAHGRGQLADLLDDRRG